MEVGRERERERGEERRGGSESFIFHLLKQMMGRGEGERESEGEGVGERQTEEGTFKTS
jgi:hypothetical protein